MQFNAFLLCSGGMTRLQPPTSCCCQRSRGANQSACALNQQAMRTPALHCTRDYRSDSGPQLFVALFFFWPPDCLYSCMLWSVFIALPFTSHTYRFLAPTVVDQFCLVSSISYFLSQTREALHFSEDEDAVIVGSLDFCSDYIDDCPWISVTQHTPQGVRGQPDGSANNKDTVCESRDECMFLMYVWQQ